MLFFKKLYINKSIIFNKFNFNIFNVYFIKKEYYYTKLKYSRVPQFDTSSGAIASLLSGFYGYLVCEKFGFELIDSGDFFFLLYYIILYYFLFYNLIYIYFFNFNFFKFFLFFFKY